MLLSKEVTVELHLTGCRLRQYIALMLRKEEIPLTPEQFMLIDLLWNLGEMTQQQLADQLQKDKNSVTQLVDALERKGFVERRRNLQDRKGRASEDGGQAQGHTDHGQDAGRHHRRRTAHPADHIAQAQ